MKKTNKGFDESRFEIMGKPNPGQPFGLIDRYRFTRVYNELGSGSVLDVGAYFGDFLKIAKSRGREIYGTEVNDARVKVANSNIGDNVVKVDFRNGEFVNLNANSIDNVVCMEVIEHIHDDHLAVSELCRIARRKVVITVPFREIIKTVLCIHCNKRTPYSGHLHSYDLGSFSNIIPSTWIVKKEIPFASKYTKFVASKIPKSSPVILLQVIDRLLLKNSGTWLLVVLEPK